MLFLWLDFWLPVTCTVNIISVLDLLCLQNVTEVAFTTYWKSWCCCTHCLFGVNECQWLVCSHMFPFIPTWYYLMIPNTCITFLLIRCSIHKYMTGNNVSEFTHSNWITLSYYPSPKHKSLISEYSTHFSHFCTQ